MTEFYHVYPKPVAPRPSVGRVVHYVPHGTPVRPDGTQAFPSGSCRSAMITEVVEESTTVGLCVINPTGLFFRPISEGGCTFDEECKPGTWHWPKRV